MAALVCAGLVGASGGFAAGGDCTRTASAGSDLQQAIDALASTRPATLCLGPGEFPLARFVSIDRDGFTLRGEGDATVIGLRVAAQSPVLVVGDYRHRTPEHAVSSVTIEKLRIVGGGTAGGEFQPDHSYLTNSALVVRAGRRVTIRDVGVNACRSACILTEHDSRDVTIERNRIAESFWDGISLNSTARAAVLGNEIRGNKAAGITIEHLEDGRIENNTLADNHTHGIYLSDSYRNRFTGNRFTGNVLSGVFLTCAIRSRDPVLCWKGSMSAENVFERNEFGGNRVAYMIGSDAAANCGRPGFRPNLSRGDVFSGDAPPGEATESGCFRYAAP